MVRTRTSAVQIDDAEPVSTNAVSSGAPDGTVDDDSDSHTTSSDDECVASDIEFDHVESSDEEDLRNTIGNVPIEWYDDHKHVGYDQHGRAIRKSKEQLKDKSEIEAFLDRMENPDYWRSVFDKQTGRNLKLTDKQVAILNNIQGHRFSEVGYNPYEPWIEWFSSEVMEHPLHGDVVVKDQFIPSRTEAKIVRRLASLIRQGKLKPRRVVEEEKAAKKKSPVVYDLWSDSPDSSEPLSRSQRARLRMYIPAPKLKPPGHAESYNPPTEYLFNKEEEAKWDNQEDYERKSTFKPQKYSTLRQVPTYSNIIYEHFERCMDLYMAPRKRRSRLDIKSSEDLLPTLPKPQDLRPFPTQSAVVYKGHTGVVRSLSLDPSGQFLASVSDDLQLRVWEVTTGRCLRTVSLPNQPAMEEEGAVMDKTMRFVGFSPKHATQSVIALSMGKSLLLFNSSVGDRLINEKTDTYFTSLKDTLLNAPSVGGLVWSWAEDDLQFSGCRAVLSHPKPIRDVCWHSNGDYLASVCGLDSTGSQTVFVHQLSKCKSQVPFTKCKGVVQRVLFHSSRPLFFVATQRYVRIYDLAQLTLVKKLQAGTRYVSSMSLHPSGDHLLLSGFDGKVLWFDLDLSTRPYRTLQQHKRAVRSVAYHPHFPLFASCSDDGATAICHGRVFSDLTRNAFIVPVKLLRGHAVSKNGLCVTDCVFHPLQPWIFTAGADGRIRLYV